VAMLQRLVDTAGRHIARPSSRSSLVVERVSVKVEERTPRVLAVGGQSKLTVTGCSHCAVAIRADHSSCLSSVAFEKPYTGL